MSNAHFDPDPRMEDHRLTDEDIERLEASDPTNERPEEYWQDEEVDWHNRCWPCHGSPS